MAAGTASVAATLAAHSPQTVAAAGGALVGQGVTNISASVRRSARHFREHGIRGLCSHLEDNFLEDLDDVEGTSKLIPLHVRMCVHSGRNILSSKGHPCGTRVKVTIGEGANAVVFDSERAPRSENPVWEFCLEHSLEFASSGLPPRVQVTVTQSDGYSWAEDGRALLGLGTDLGGVEIKLPVRPPVWPTVKNLTLSHPVLGTVNRSHVDPCKIAQILVVWQVTDPETHPEVLDPLHGRRINLMSVAELSMDGGHEERQMVCVDSRVRSLMVSGSADTGEEVKIRVDMAIIFRRDGNEVAGTHRESSDEHGDDEERGWWEAAFSEPVFQKGPLAGAGGLVRYVWHDVDRAESDAEASYAFWHPACMQLRERTAYLPGYHIRLKVVQETTDESGESRVAEVGSWEERLDWLLQHCELEGLEWFNAILVEKGSSRAVGQVQMSVDVFTRRPHQSLDRYDVEYTGKNTSIGFIDSREHHTQDIYLTIHGDQFLFGESPWNVRPVLRVLLGQSVSENVIITSCHLVSSDSGLVEFWLEDVHISAPKNEQHLRLQLWNQVKSGLSTEDVLVCETEIRKLVPHNIVYWRHCFGGSVGSTFPFKCLLMSRNMMAPSAYRGTLAVHAASLPPDLDRVKRHVRDAYFVVQLCVRLHRGLYIDGLRGHSVKVFVRVAGCKGFHEEGNAILLFQGKVDDAGVLRFKSTDDNSGGDRWWVQKRTPPLYVPPCVRYAYIHIVREDQATRPWSAVFGRYRLKSSPHEAKWKDLRYDQSLETPTPAPFISTHFAGCLLGAAWFERGKVVRVTVFVDDDIIQGISFEHELGHGVSTFGHAIGISSLWDVPGGEHLVSFSAYSDQALRKCCFGTESGLYSSPWFGVGHYADPPKEWRAKPRYHITRLEMEHGLSGPVPVGIEECRHSEEDTALERQRLLPRLGVPPEGVQSAQQDGLGPVRPPRHHRRGGVLAALCCSPGGGAGEAPPSATAGGRLDLEQGPASEKVADLTEPQDWGIFFCHVDLLAGGSLFPPSNCSALQAAGLLPEEGSLLQKRYRVRAESSEVDVGAEFDPRLSQSRRLALPVRLIERAVRPPEPESLYVEPPPPVLVEVSVVGQGNGEAPFGLAVVKNCEWWQHDLDHGLEPINLNTAHKAHWYMLDSGHVLEFDPDLSGGISAVFREKPRLLLAALFSRLQDASAPGRSLLETPTGLRGSSGPLGGTGLREETFIIEVDVLGIRRLHESLQGSSHELGLTVASLWHGDGGGPGGQAPALKFDFNEAKSKRGVRVPYRDCVAPVSAKDHPNGSEARVERAVSILAQHCHLFKKEPSPDLLGSSQELEFVALEIPYLQPQRRSDAAGKSRGKMRLPSPRVPSREAPAGAEAPLAKARSPRDWLGEERPDAFLGGGALGRGGAAARSAGGPPPAAPRSAASPPVFVLLPELLFRLQVRSHGEPTRRWDPSSFFYSLNTADPSLGTGTLTVPLPLPVPDEHHYHRLHQLSDDMINPESPLVKAERRLQGLRGPEEGGPTAKWDVMRDALEDVDDIAEMFVDVFAAREGMVHLNSDLRVGRCLRQHCLFSIHEQSKGDVVRNSEGADDDASEVRMRTLSAKGKISDLRSGTESRASLASVESFVDPMKERAASFSQSTISCRSQSQSDVVVNMGSEDRDDVDEEERANKGTMVQYFNAVAAILGLPAAEPLHIRVTPTLSCCSEVLNPHERYRKYSTSSRSHMSMLDSRSAWSVGPEQAQGAWLQIDLGAVRWVTGLIVQGRGGGRPETREWVRLARVDVAASRRSPSKPGAAQAELGWRTLGEFRCNDDPETKAPVAFPETVAVRFIRIFPLEWQGSGPSMRVGVSMSQDHFTRPLGPSELFSDVIGDDLRLNDLRAMTTKNMGAKTSKKGYRSVTHLAAPQLAKKHAHARSLDGNLHTFVRPVGHVITSQDRDSRLLCRLRMGLPMDYVQIADSAPEDAVDETLHQLEESMTNFLVVKFTKPGTVVWSAPLSGGASWRAAGEVLFAVQLNDGSGQVVVVRTPNFDIRYPNETSWVVRKTLTTRWRSMEEQLYTNLNGNSAQRMAANLSKLPALPMLDESGAEFARKLRKAHGKTDELPPVLLPSAGSDAEEVAVDRQASMFARGVQLPEVDTGDGYNRPIYVEKHAFVCRIRKREGGGVFCRRQSNNWWRAVLESCGDLGKELSLHDVRRAPTLEEDVDKVKSTALRRLLNVDKTLPLLDTGLQGDAAILKGHIRMRRRDAPSPRMSSWDAAVSEDALATFPAGAGDEGGEQIAKPKVTAFCPIENLWVRQTVRLSIYVLSVEGLDNFNAGLLGQRRVQHPFVVVSTDGQEQRLPNIGAEMIHSSEGVGSLDFYQWCTMTLTLPGPSLLRLEVRDMGVFGRERVLGQTSIDVEDRWLALAEVDLVRGTTKAGIASEVMPTSEIQTSRPPLEQRWMTKSDMRKAVSKRWPWRNPDDATSLRASWNSQLTIRPAMRPPARSPMESRMLMIDDPSTGIRRSVGKLRYIIDMLPGNVHAKPPEAMTLKKFPFHIMIKVWGVNGIGIWRDAWAERNDVKVRGTLVVDDLNGTRTLHHRETDTHQMATKEASFNQKWTFALEAPVAAVSLVLRLVDVDTGGLREDLIYKKEVLALDHAVLLCWRNTMHAMPLPGEFFQEVLFASWPPDLADEPVGAWCWLCGCCGCPRRGHSDRLTSEGLVRFWERHCRCCPQRCGRLVRRQAPALCCNRYRRRWQAGGERGPPKPARLALSVEVKHSDGTQPTEESEQFREPKGRITFQEAISDPFSTFKRVIGPRNVRILLRFLCCIGFVFMLFLAALTMSLLVDYQQVFH